MKQYNSDGMLKLCEEIALNKGKYNNDISVVARGAILVAHSVKEDLADARVNIRQGKYSWFDIDMISMYSDDPNDVRIVYEQIWRNSDPDNLSQHLFNAVVTMCKRFHKYTVGHLNQMILDMWNESNGIHLYKARVADALAENRVHLNKETVRETFRQYTENHRGDAVYVLLRLSAIDAYATSHILEHYRELSFRDKLHFIKSTIGLEKVNYLWSAEMVDLLDTNGIAEENKVMILKAAMRLDGHMPALENAIKVLTLDKEFMAAHSALIFNTCYKLKLFDIMNTLSARFDSMDPKQQIEFMVNIELMFAYQNRRLDG